MWQLVYVIHWVHIDQFDNVELAYKDGQQRLDLLVSRLQAMGGYKLRTFLLSGSTCEELRIKNNNLIRFSEAPENLVSFCGFFP